MLATAEQLVQRIQPLTDEASRLDIWKSQARTTWDGVLRAPTPEWALHYAEQTVRGISTGAGWLMNGLPEEETRLVDAFYRQITTIDPSDAQIQVLRDWQIRHSVDLSDLLDKPAHPPQADGPSSDTDVTYAGRSVLDLIRCARALADEVQQFTQAEPDDHGFGAAVSRMANAVATALDAEWAAYEALNMSSSVSAGLSHAFGGGSRATNRASSSLQETAWRVARDHADHAAQLNQALSVWQMDHGIAKTPRDGRPRIEG
ncbi:MAG: hypothetical protein L0G99_13905 [Propionibacteriales bacterium]|nr:hypothetical protein [Propionibacteriales bacterium]